MSRSVGQHGGMSLTLRPLAPADETRAREIHQAMLGDGFEFLLHEGPWAEVIEHHRREALGEGLPAGRVRCSYLIAEQTDPGPIPGPIVGRVSIRHQLNDYLLEVGGHVGYGVAPEHRRQGHATEILRQSVALLAAEGVDQILVTCDEGNIASARTIETCGGVLEDIRPVTGEAAKRRYWITPTP